ncbi:hypothetical protein FMK56_12590 [Klebsiella oxytoca]|uniref:hypothetical protein n=1 Tax=Klebsiella oxytoca TaxID=571 RepID=UPI001CCDD9F6|nr:hypothetical protein [Klebsiella oxytoca]EKZ9478285.1 hypothetical protein [Klebsiella oxytoca]ELJ5741442.1 hypothetical protein [Klebsiella oxytoca]MBZ7165202.1 hypothetical protein [Klebsiella oxytoca]
MTITLQAVNELIQSLESAGELSIKERKYLELAKAYLDVTAENVGLKAGIGEAYDGMEQLDDGYFSTDADGEPMDTLITLVDAQAAIQRLAIDIETPATDHIVAGIKADGVDIIRNALIKFVEDEVGPNDVVPGLIRGAEICVSVADSLREGAK